MIGAVPLVLGCASAPPPAPARPVRHPLAAPPPDVQAECLGGLLCEDKQLLGGFRVPRGCRRVTESPALSLCVLGDVPPGGALVREFVLSRYENASQGQPGEWRAATDWGTLQVLVRGNIAQFLAISKERPPAVDSAAAGR